MIAVDYHTKKKTIWGSGNVANIRKMAVENRATAVMVNIDSLTPMQQQVENAQIVYNHVRRGNIQGVHS